MSSNYWFDGGEQPHGSGQNTNCPPTAITLNSDGQTRVVGLIRDSGNQVYDGFLRVTAQNTMANYSRSPRTVVSRRSQLIPIVLGYLDCLLVNSVDSGSAYLFELIHYQSIDTEDGPVQQEVITDSWYAQVPRASTAGGSIELADLLPTPISADRLDTSVYRIAEAIVTDPDLRQRAVSPIRLAGIYDPLRSYQYGDLVSVVGSPYQAYVLASRSASAPAPLPLSSTIWQRVL